MRILHILDHSIPLHSGYTFRTLSILKEQRALGWETFHLTGPKQENCNLFQEDVDEWHFYRTPPRGSLASKLPVLNQIDVINSLTHRLSEVAKLVKPDILHAHSPVLNALPALRVGRRLGIPVVYEVRAFWEDAAVDHGTSSEWGIRYRLTRGLESYALQRADAITTICEGLRSDILERGIAPGKVTVIPNAVNIENFSMGETPDAQLSKDLGLEGKLSLGFIGSFYAYEGLRVLLQALPEMLSKNRDIRILLVGGGPQAKELKALAKQLGIEDKVIFTGRVPHDQVRRYYNLIDVLIYPRLKMRLTDLVTPLKPLEAMAQGRLVVASDVGGHLELIQDEKNGILFKAGAADALAAKVLNLLSRPDLWPSLRAAARNFVETQRNWPGSVARYKDVYGPLARRSVPE
ncbi:PEP-CTERM/exosortase A-associated glycosyltransferase, Daro_2409 family [Nitrosospira sp. Nl5]|uniref:TIGR04063 family PEP-CTERM/XrtA system glycosyltransferase n=1 Tax=Nitrosospira sp. Nl5 TaxID=200120 RepID=UPI00088820C2|nr:TIGR04063 family PEP-CTERM/XrtA system glycosyltransferase [Nitrosospira sp. Nl5]SCY15720.1 PEP-CTERM/exosortase A-associated glycosyltransferase, Daro_2409 family [Nitrosospira sp. Nl5]